MRKILLLSGLLASLLVFTYYTEELANKNKEQERLERIETVKFDIKDIDKIEFTHGVITRGEKQAKKGDELNYFGLNSKYPIERELIRYIFNKLSDIKIQRFLTEEELSQNKNEIYFPEKKIFMTFKAGNEEISYVLGNKLPHDQSFYFKIIREGKTKIVIANDVSDEFYQGQGGVRPTEEQVNTSSKKYQRLLAIFQLREQDLYERKVFIDKVKIKNLFFKSQANQAFYLDVVKKETTPSAFEGLSYREDFISKYLEKFKQIKAENIFLPEEGQISSENLKGELTRISWGFKEHELVLYEQFGTIKGFFLRYNKAKPIFQLSKVQAQLLLMDKQDFWDKVILPKNKKFGSQEEHFDLIFSKQKKFSLFLPVADNFTVNMAESGKIFNGKEVIPNYKNFQRLFNLLSGSGDYPQAFRVSSFDGEEDKNRAKLADKNQFKMNIAGKEIAFEKNGVELLIKNISDGFKFHYIIGNRSPITFNYLEYFYFRSPTN